MLRAHRASTLNCTARAHPFPRQLAYFCGAAHAAECAAAGPASLARAKANIDNDFVMVRGEVRALAASDAAPRPTVPSPRADSRDAQVGLVERLEDSARVLEHRLPALFGGAVDTLARIGPTRVNTKRATPSPAAATKQSVAPPRMARHLRQRGSDRTQRQLATQGSSVDLVDNATAAEAHGHAALAPEAREYLERLLHYEIELYAWVRRRFEAQLCACDTKHPGCSSPHPGRTSV